MVNENVTQKEAFELLKASESREMQNLRKRVKQTYNTDLSYKIIGDRNYKDWLKQKQREEVKQQRILYFSVTSLSKFLKIPYEYTKKDGTVVKKLRSVTYCERCLKPFYHDSKTSAHHLENCRGRGVKTGRCIMPWQSQKLCSSDGKQFDRFKSKELSPITILCDTETLILPGDSHRLCRKCHQFGYGSNR